jgi:hypothetical protein
MFQVRVLAPRNEASVSLAPKGAPKSSLASFFGAVVGRQKSALHPGHSIQID